ncbi:hypothetical protein [Nocardioides convexus]|uniref:hypothetical protein n=1 Tax=Nocardioides convexus TaxID=2712224 RepID=UPI002418220F|nr:hypothetical protein [Nocardioides convexus]
MAHHEGESPASAIAAHNAATMTALALKAGGASLEAHLAGTAVDAGGLIPDIQDNNSWTQVLDEVDPLESARGAVLQLDRALPHQLPAPARAARGGPERRAPGLRRQRLGDGGSVLPPLQGRRAPAHQHGQGRAQHDDPHLLGGDVRDRQDPDDRRRHRLDHRRAPAPREACGSPPRAGTHRSTWSTAPPGSTTRSCAARRARTSTAASSRTTRPRPGDGPPSARSWTTTGPGRRPRSRREPAPGRPVRRRRWSERARSPPWRWIRSRAG